MNALFMIGLLTVLFALAVRTTYRPSHLESLVWNQKFLCRFVDTCLGYSDLAPHLWAVCFPESVSESFTAGFYRTGDAVKQ